jgi:hypothetical protein
MTTLIPGPEIYDNIEALDMPADHQTWTSGGSTVFHELISKLHPDVIVEVGSWKGVSACKMAMLAGPHCRIYCVDTWLGGIEQLGAEVIDYSIPVDPHGYPRLYHQFLVNVKANGLETQIVPIANTSTIGARILRHNNVQAQLVYIDGSHTYADCYRDLCDYWPILAPGGTMLIDDYKSYPGVYAAVTRFTEENNLWCMFDTKDEKTFATLGKAA